MSRVLVEIFWVGTRLPLPLCGRDSLAEETALLGSKRLALHPSPLVLPATSETMTKVLMPLPALMGMMTTPTRAQRPASRGIPQAGCDTVRSNCMSPRDSPHLRASSHTTALASKEAPPRERWPQRQRRRQRHHPRTLLPCRPREQAPEHHPRLPQQAPSIPAPITRTRTSNHRTRPSTVALGPLPGPMMMQTKLALVHPPQPIMPTTLPVLKWLAQ